MTAHDDMVAEMDEAFGADPLAEIEVESISADDQLEKSAKKTAKKMKAKKEAEAPKTWRDNLTAYRKKYQAYTVLPEFKGSIKSWSTALDLALNTDGFAAGSAVRLSGPTGTGKTAACATMAGMHLESGGAVLWIDSEKGLKKHTAHWNGLDMDHPAFLYHSSTGHDNIITIELMAQFVEEFLTACLPTNPDKPETGTRGLIIIDSISNMPAADEVAAKSIGDAVVAASARLLARWGKLIPVYLDETGSVMILVEQVVANFATGFGQPATKVGGGNRVKHIAQINIELFNKKQIRDTKGPKDAPKDVTANIIGFKAVKNRWDVPMREGDYMLRYEDHIGIDRLSELVSLGVLSGEISKAKGSGMHYLPFYNENGEAVGVNGADNTRDWLLYHPNEAHELDLKIRAALKDPNALLVSEPGAPEEE
jgi:RecA/RadA recombinase